MFLSYVLSYPKILFSYRKPPYQKDEKTQSVKNLASNQEGKRIESDNTERLGKIAYRDDHLQTQVSLFFISLTGESKTYLAFRFQFTLVVKIKGKRSSCRSFESGA